MRTLNAEQKNFLKSIDSKKNKKKLKKAFKKSNKEKTIEDCKLFLKDYFSIITNPLFEELNLIGVTNTKKLKKMIKKLH